MGLFFPDDNKGITVGRAVGFARYRQLLENNFKPFFLTGFLALIFLIPFSLGMVYSILSESILVMVLSALLGGAVAGPGTACMYDLLLRRLRDDRDDWWHCYKKSMHQNWKASILPGILTCLFLGLVIFCGALLLWAKMPISWASVGLLLVSSVIFTAVGSVWWPQVVLFEQRMSIQLKNAVKFILFHPVKTLSVAVLQVLWWLIAFLLMPWSAFLVPFLNVWYILFLANFFLYRSLDDALRIEEQIEAHFPGQIQIEDDL